MGEGTGATFDSATRVESAKFVTLEKLRELRRVTQEEGRRAPEAGQKPVDTAISRLNFINETLGPIANDELRRSNRQVWFDRGILHTLNPFNVAPGVAYNPFAGSVGSSEYWLGTERNFDASVSASDWIAIRPEDMQGIWDDKVDRGLVKHLARPKVYFIDRFIKEVSKIK